MTPAFRRRSFQDLQPQINLNDHLPHENQAPTANQSQDIKQSNLASASIHLQTLDSVMKWLSTH